MKDIIQIIIGVILLMIIGAAIGGNFGTAGTIICCILGGIIGFFLGPWLCGFIWDLILAIFQTAFKK